MYNNRTMPRVKGSRYPKSVEDSHLLAVRVTMAQAEKLRELAALTGRSESDLVREAIMALLGVYYAEKADVLAEAPHEGVA